MKNWIMTTRKWEIADMPAGLFDILSGPGRVVAAARTGIARGGSGTATGIFLGKS